MPPITLIVGLLALPFVPLFARWGHSPEAEDRVWLAALAGLLLSAGLRQVLRVPAAPRAVRAVALGAVAALWGYFFVADLWRARFAWTLLLVPVGALLGAAAGRRHVALGVVVALTAIWALMVRRADNGCTGVSGAFAAVVVLHPVLAMWTAPFLFARPQPTRADS